MKMNSIRDEMRKELADGWIIMFIYDGYDFFMYIFVILLVLLLLYY